jgi:hypothetical protein
MVFIGNLDRLAHAILVLEYCNRRATASLPSRVPSAQGLGLSAEVSVGASMAYT